MLGAEITPLVAPTASSGTRVAADHRPLERLHRAGLAGPQPGAPAVGHGRAAERAVGHAVAVAVDPRTPAGRRRRPADPGTGRAGRPRRRPGRRTRGTPRTAPAAAHRPERVVAAIDEAQPEAGLAAGGVREVERSDGVVRQDERLLLVDAAGALGGKDPLPAVRIEVRQEHRGVRLARRRAALEHDLAGVADHGAERGVEPRAQPRARRRCVGRLTGLPRRPVLTRNVPPNTFWGMPNPGPLARVTVPLTPGHTQEEFVKGLRPIKKNKITPEE